MRAGIVVNVTGQTAVDLRRSSWIAARRRSMCGGPRSSLPPQTAEIMRRSGKAKPVVWTWQARVHAGRRRRLAARQDAQAWQGAAAGRDRAAGHRPGDRAASGRSHALDRPDAGEGRRCQLAVGATYSRGPPTRAAPHPLDNYATHKHPKVRKWLAQHPRWTFHFTPTSASWLNAVEGFFAKLTNRRLKRGVFRSVADLEDAINHFVA